MNNDLEQSYAEMERAIYAYANAVEADALERHQIIKQARRDGVQPHLDPESSLWRALLGLTNSVLADKDEERRFRPVEPGHHIV